MRRWKRQPERPPIKTRAKNRPPSAGRCRYSGDGAFSGPTTPGLYDYKVQAK